MMTKDEIRYLKALEAVLRAAAKPILHPSRKEDPHLRVAVLKAIKLRRELPDE